MPVEATVDVAGRSAPVDEKRWTSWWRVTGSRIRTGVASAEQVTQDALVLQDVVAGYGRSTVLQDLNLRVSAGEVVALVGRNGAGKSTTAQVACGLLNPRSGTVLVAGRAPGTRRGRFRDVGHCPQDCALFPALTIHENLSVFASLQLGDRQSRARRIDRLLSDLDLFERADQIVGSLSGGWKKRVNLAVALMGDARLLVLDEPTEAVDEDTRLLIGDAVRNAASDGTGCLLVSHDDRFVDRVADRIALIEDGCVALEGCGKDLVSQTFGSSQFLELRFDAPVGWEDAGRLRDVAFAPADNGTCWRFVGCDPIAQARLVERLVERNAGSMTVRRPVLSDLAKSDGRASP
ncbi:ABC transporter ATP-binding protein [Aureimonas jatrophae]|uniref:ABC-2 type transport system ATP-binding protein n=1 Tax=Aureimonas jatrophae TaxID=1166073 RepID=A0A1H0K9P7_9HYPH|nr:ABC transporter ATP-binding protein [Aureimonas jatrophae]MBB3951015.1 ABC-2 type transport system ATP-binding protein [Aureimonas jatrophae]SDO52614.1 ABC-2 type transport system ATP-binding protein [Aureimonas jatrophae]